MAPTIGQLIDAAVTQQQDSGQGSQPPAPAPAPQEKQATAQTGSSADTQLLQADFGDLATAINYVKWAYRMPGGDTGWQWTFDKRAAGFTDRLVDSIGRASVNDNTVELDAPLRLQFKDKAARDLFLSLGRKSANTEPSTQQNPDSAAEGQEKSASSRAAVVRQAYSQLLFETAVEKVAAAVFGMPKAGAEVNEYEHPSLTTTQAARPLVTVPARKPTKQKDSAAPKKQRNGEKMAYARKGRKKKSDIRKQANALLGRLAASSLGKRLASQAGTALGGGTIGAGLAGAGLGAAGTADLISAAE